MSSNCKNSHKNEANQNFSFPEKRGSCHVCWRMGSSHTPGHSGDSISLILDEGIAFAGNLPDRGLGNWFEALVHFKHKQAQRPLAIK
jgi:hypothetical protein